MGSILEKGTLSEMRSLLEGLFQYPGQKSHDRALFSIVSNYEERQLGELCDMGVDSTSLFRWIQ